MECLGLARFSTWMRATKIWFVLYCTSSHPHVLSKHYKLHVQETVQFQHKKSSSLYSRQHSIFFQCLHSFCNKGKFLAKIYTSCLLQASVFTPSFSLQLANAQNRELCQLQFPCCTKCDSCFCSWNMNPTDWKYSSPCKDLFFDSANLCKILCCIQQEWIACNTHRILDKSCTCFTLELKLLTDFVISRRGGTRVPIFHNHNETINMKAFFLHVYKHDTFSSSHFQSSSFQTNLIVSWNQ